MHQTLTSDSLSCLELPTYVSMIMRTSPMISVIVAAHDLQGQLESCLRSILNQSFRDLEVVAVLDQSPECPANVVDDYAQRDGRVSVVRLKGVVGIGRIRNAGAEHAAGDYLLFLDSDHIVGVQHFRPWPTSCKLQTSRTFFSSGIRVCITVAPGTVPPPS